MKTEKKTFFNSTVWKYLVKNKPALISLYGLAVLSIIALFAPVIANDKPWYARYNDENYFPAFSFSNTVEMTNPLTGKKEIVQASQVAWKKLKLKNVIPAPITYSPGKRDQSNADYSPPGNNHHWLGTTGNGSDVLAGLLYGTRISLSIGILSMLIASLIGIALGSAAGYLGDHQLRCHRGNAWMMLGGMIPAFFYSFYVRSNMLADAFNDPGIMIIVQLFFSLIIFLGILFIFFRLGNLLNFSSFFSRRIYIPVDALLSRTIEIFISIPRLVLIISFAAITKPSFINIILIIGFTSWTEIARFTRAEFLHIRNSDYVDIARALGYSDFRIILKHALPNALAPATVAIVFGIASAILIESGLSFLGIGVPHDVVTWGSLLFSGKENFEAWWLVVFPGLAIFLTVTAFNVAGEGLRDAMDVKSRIY